MRAAGVKKVLRFDQTHSRRWRARLKMKNAGLEIPVRHDLKSFFI
jgi:hypothetical protein